jgi:hypothetical protein
MPFHLVEYTDPLWRADYNYFAKNGLASNNYNGAKYKFFATQEHEVETYTRKGMSKVKKWVPQKALHLLPMFHRPTRDAVYAAMSPAGKNAMDVAFPIGGDGQVYRVSEEHTTQFDYTFLDELCQMAIADGYIIPAQTPRVGVGAFHSEIGLCFAAFDSLHLADVKTSAPPPMTKRNRGRRAAFNNNNAANIRPRRFAMFMNANNMPN